MSGDQNTEGQDNTNGGSDGEVSQEGSILSQASDTTNDGQGDENLDQQNADADNQDDGSGDEGDGDGDDQNKATEEYGEFNLPEGFEALDEALIAEATPLFKESGLSQEQAQKYIDLYAKTIQGQIETRSQAFTDLNNANIEAIKSHPELGGVKLDESLNHVAKGIDTLMGNKAGDFRAFLDQTGSGNHPLMFELLAKVGKSVSEDGYITGGKSDKKQSAAEVMYGADGKGKASA